MGFCFWVFLFSLGEYQILIRVYVKNGFFFFLGFVFAYNCDVLCGFRSEEMAGAREITAAEFLQVCCHVHSVWLLRNYKKIYERLGIL